MIPKHPWIVGKKIETLCRKALYDFEMIEKDKSIAIALSGGKDSLTLLYMLSHIMGRGFAKIDLHAIHVGGSFSCGAEISSNFLKTICDQLNVNLVITQSNATQDMDCYSCARERRKAIFKEAKKLGCETIAFGHHKDDNIQTLLLNLFQKGEFASMLAKIKMHKFGITIIRPLIYVEQKEIIKFAQHYDFLRARCNCPRGVHSYRKKVDDLINEIEKIFPHLKANLATSALLYGSDKAGKLPDGFDL